MGRLISAAAVAPKAWIPKSNATLQTAAAPPSNDRSLPIFISFDSLLFQSAQRIAGLRRDADFTTPKKHLPLHSFIARMLLIQIYLNGWRDCPERDNLSQKDGDKMNKFPRINAMTRWARCRGHFVPNFGVNAFQSRLFQRAGFRSSAFSASSISFSTLFQLRPVPGILRIFSIAGSESLGRASPFGK